MSDRNEGVCFSFSRRSVVVVSSLLLLFSHPQHRGDFDEALLTFQKIQRSQREKRGEVHYLVGSALHNVGVVQLWAGRCHEALRSFRGASRIRFQSLRADHPALAVSFSDESGCVLKIQR